MEWFSSLPYVLQALAATLFTWAVTAAGAATVVFFKKINNRLLGAMTGFASGVMISASFWSLLLPASEMCASLGFSAPTTLLSGFLSGGILLYVGDKALSHRSLPVCDAKRRSAMIIFSVTLHNVPEGLCVGVAFGSLAYGLEGATLATACLLTLGIGLQNFPEGAAISLPLRKDGFSRKKAFFWGQISGAVEPLAGIAGALLVLYVRSVLPFCLSFAAGAMIYVVAAELIPESEGENINIAALFTVIGFSVMMFLDTFFS